MTLSTRFVFSVIDVRETHPLYVFEITGEDFDDLFKQADVLCLKLQKKFTRKYGYQIEDLSEKYYFEYRGKSITI